MVVPFRKWIFRLKARTESVRHFVSQVITGLFLLIFINLYHAMCVKASELHLVIIDLSLILCNAMKIVTICEAVFVSQVE